MPSRALIVVSLAANLALVLLIGWLATTRLFPRPVPARAASHVAAKQSREAGAPTAFSRPTTILDATTSSQASAGATNAPFHWAQLQPADFRNYTTNLRAAGCPEKTVRDIVLPAIGRHYEKRRDAVPPRDFWQSGAAVRATELAERQRAAAIDVERTAMLRELFGLDRVPYRYSGEDNNENFIGLCVLGFLPEEKFAAMIEAFTRADADKKAVTDAADDILLDEDREKLSAIYDATRETLRRLVGPVDFEEGERRIRGLMLAIQWLDTGSSPGAFEMTGGELREFSGRVVALRDPLRENFIGDGARSDIEAFKDTVNDLARGFFGEARYAELELARNSEFQEIFDSASEHKVPRAQAVKVHELLRAAEEQEVQLREDASLTAAHRSAALAVLRADFERGTVAALGPAAAADYLKKTSFLKPPEPVEAKRVTNKGSENP